MAIFTSAHVIGPDWRELCDRASARLGDTPRGDLGFLYLADDLAAHTDQIVDRLRDRSGIAHWVGCTGMGLCSNGRETYAEPALSVLATPYRTEQFRVLPALDGEPGDWLDATRTWRERELATVGVVHGDPSSTRLPELLARLGDGLGGGFLVGGIASAEKMPVQIADRATGGGLSGVLFSGRVAITTGLSQGCGLIGSRHRITSGQHNVIEGIDDRPALDVLKEEIGEILASDLQRAAGYIFVALPVTGTDTADYLVRNLIGVDPDRGLLAVGDIIAPGMSIQFARRDAETARADLRQMIRGLRGRLPGEPRGALYHTCLGRGRHLFGDESAELGLVREELGDVPLAGFYANGEISHNRLYGYTGVLTLFS